MEDMLLMNKDSQFSTRHGFREVTEAEITIHYDAPHDLRGVIVDLAYDNGFYPKTLRKLICMVLRKRFDSNNWSDSPIDTENRQLIDAAEWYKVYDLVEAIAKKAQNMKKFERELNQYFTEEGIGWKLSDGKLEARNPQVLEQTIHSAITKLQRAGIQTAQGELHEALIDLSRRPEADITGAIQHSMHRIPHNSLVMM
jgi:hypothetical protein